MHRGRDMGFTLIELLVVVAIIALLIGILLPSLAGARETARIAACAANARSVAQAAATYSEGNKSFFPSSYVHGQVTDNPAPADGYIHWSHIAYTGNDAMFPRNESCEATVDYRGVGSANGLNELASYIEQRVVLRRC